MLAAPELPASIASLLLKPLGDGALIHSRERPEQTTFVILFMSSADPTRACVCVCVFGGTREAALD